MNAADAQHSDVDVDVLVVGAGQCGIMLANLLGTYGTRALVIDREPDVIDYPRAVGIDDESLRSCQAVGLVDHMFLGIIVVQQRGKVRKLLRAPEGATGVLAGLRNWLARVWHWLALLLIANSFSSVGLGLADAMVVYCAPLLAGALAMIPGGLGLTEASLEGALIHFGGPGVTTAVAGAITILIRLVTLWFAVALGFLALLTWRLRRSTQSLNRGPFTAS